MEKAQDHWNQTNFHGEWQVFFHWNLGVMERLAAIPNHFEAKKLMMKLARFPNLPMIVYFLSLAKDL